MTLPTPHQSFGATARTLALCGLVTASSSMAAPARAPAAATATPPPAARPTPAPSGVIQQLVGRGVSTCVPLMSRLDQESARPSQSRSGQAIWKPDRPNDLVAAAVIGEAAPQGAGGQPGVEIVTAAPSAKGECSGDSVHVTTTETPCASVIQSLLASGGKYGGPVVDGLYKVAMPNAQFILANGARGTCLVTRFIARYPG